MVKKISILGATGSIGNNTLGVIDLHPDKFEVFALAANNNIDKMAELYYKYRPKYVVMSDDKSAAALQDIINHEVLIGEEGLSFVASAPEVDMVMCAIVGAAGMLSTLSSCMAGKRVLLANKESLVLAGDIIIRTAKENNAEIIPIDSEHSAIFQAIQAGLSGFKHVEITASGGPFLNTPIKDLVKVTPEEALNHPNWNMGAKISIDSATMMNKGLEVIEAHYLFGLQPEDIKVIIHPQSIIHSSVYFKDGSVISQLGNPDMKTPIAYGLNYPERVLSGVNELDLSKHTLEFYAVDYDKFSSLKLAYLALRKGASFMGALNAANEVAVEAFLQRKINFLEIPKIMEKTLEKTQDIKLNSLEDVFANDQESRATAKAML